MGLTLYGVRFADNGSRLVLMEGRRHPRFGPAGIRASPFLLGAEPQASPRINSRKDNQILFIAQPFRQISFWIKAGIHLRGFRIEGRSL